MAQIEAGRVAQDPAYAASLSDSDWYALAQDPVWQEMAAEQSELVADVIAKYGNKIPGVAGGSTPTEIPAFAITMSVPPQARSKSRAAATIASLSVMSTA